MNHLPFISNAITHLQYIYHIKILYREINVLLSLLSGIFGQLFLMIDIIKFMAKAGNFTYTLVEADDVCGKCYSRFNCSGMTGLVNRGEVDLALGKNGIGV